jgi:hypothetical protein
MFGSIDLVFMIIICLLLVIIDLSFVRLIVIFMLVSLNTYGLYIVIFGFMLIVLVFYSKK